MYTGMGPGLTLCMSCGKKTPAGPNRFESPQLLDEEDLINRPAL
jgi:hypothetical protein